MDARVRAAVAHVAAHGADGPPLPADVPVTLAFHPDRVDAGGRSVLAALAADGRYRSQFETGTSNGGLTAHPGGDRWRWEQRLFGGAYDDAPPADRPVYGALDHRRTGLGGAPRFGSSFLLLRSEVLDRVTLCFPDSVFEPTDLAVAQRCPLLDLADAALASGGVDVLDAYVEAHVHGGVEVSRDVEAVVLDPSYAGTAVEQEAAALGVPVRWHPGFALGVARLDDEEVVAYRGPASVALAREAAAGASVLTPAAIGVLRRTGSHDLQAVKHVWHLVARFGADPTGP
ncbi:DUF3626 domain-containing protein [Lapillicoccus jejuensis]|uniref:Uncharacterized protein DUF3626 n=1 Tax=Lapillicoccus jejuensis TaxID=402171 RepID=A0A542DYS3_9MICO|nr:DUF3626 domain-containing protein [Lapillicoccus jejuensis]TQJ08228.1 uncharacterized protein DUF3626 [Lapillicoccus jejuensis]